LAWGGANTGLGNYISTTNITAGSSQNLFLNITAADNAASVVDYQCAFLYNDHATIAFANIYCYLTADIAGGATISFATDNIAASAIGNTSAQAATIASRTTAPTGISSWSSATTLATGLYMGDIPAGFCKAFWIRRTATNSSALTADGFTFTVDGGSL
jgi:hypothetical protein